MGASDTDQTELERQLEDLKTERIALESEIRRLRQRQRLWNTNETKLVEVQRLACIASYEVSVLGGQVTWSGAADALFGSEYQSYRTLLQLFELVHPDDRALVREAYARGVNDGKPYEMLHRIVTSAGEVRVVNHYFKTFMGDNDIPLKTIGLIQDVTEREHTEAKLQAAPNEPKSWPDRLPYSWPI